MLSMRLATDFPAGDDDEPLRTAALEAWDNLIALSNDLPFPKASLASALPSLPDSFVTDIVDDGQVGQAAAAASVADGYPDEALELRRITAKVERLMSFDEDDPFGRASPTSSRQIVDKQDPSVNVSTTVSAGASAMLMTSAYVSAIPSDKSCTAAPVHTNNVPKETAIDWAQLDRDFERELNRSDWIVDLGLSKAFPRLYHTAATAERLWGPIESAALGQGTGATEEEHTTMDDDAKQYGCETTSRSHESSSSSSPISEDSEDGVGGRSDSSR